MPRPTRDSLELIGADRVDHARGRAQRRGLSRLSARVLASPLYRRLWLSGLIYYSARWVEIVISGWIVLAITNSPFLVGLSGFCRVLPMLIFGLLFGAFADRFRQIDILIAIHASSLLAALVLTGAFALGTAPLWLILVAIGCIGSGSAADFSARRTLIDEIQERSLLANTMSLESLSMNGAKVVAALVAGVLLSLGGATLGYACLATLYAGGLAWVVAVKGHLPRADRRPHAAALRVITSLRTGWAATLRIPVVRGVFIVTIIINVMVFPYQQLIAIVAGDILSVGPFWMGVLAGADGIGAALAAAWLAFGSGSRRPGLLFAGGSTATAALLIVLALSPIFALSFAIQVVLGACAGLFGAYQAALVLSAAPADARARALGLIATAIGMTPFGMLTIGGLSAAAGAQAAIAALGALALVGLSLVLALNSPLRAARIT